MTTWVPRTSKFHFAKLLTIPPNKSFKRFGKSFQIFSSDLVPTESSTTMLGLDFEWQKENWLAFMSLKRSFQMFHTCAVLIPWWTWSETSQYYAHHLIFFREDIDRGGGDTSYQELFRKWLGVHTKLDVSVEKLRFSAIYWISTKRRTKIKKNKVSEDESGADFLLKLIARQTDTLRCEAQFIRRSIMTPKIPWRSECSLCFSFFSDSKKSDIFGKYRELTKLHNLMIQWSEH